MVSRQGSTVVFDTHTYVKQLVAAGVGEAQAEVHAEAMVGLLEGTLATKWDRERTEHKLQRTEHRLRAEIQSVRGDLIRWMAGLMTGHLVAIIVVLLGLHLGS